MATNPTSAPLDVLTIDRPEQLKALGHPLRLRVLQVLGEQDEVLTNRELAQRLDVDPGHLHFHVRMLHRAGLIELVDSGRGREKPYRAVAHHMKVGAEFRAAGLATEIQVAMLEEITRGWEAHGPRGEFRSAQLNVRLDPERVKELFNRLVEHATELEDPDEDLTVITVVAHPATESPKD
jgi:DNA-binding transcriptional ArsR family regulator